MDGITRVAQPAGAATQAKSEPEGLNPRQFFPWPDSHRSFWTSTILALGAAFALVSVTTMLWWPLGYDQAIFASNGATILRGGLPYKDAWETRGPLSFYLFAFVELLFGRTAVGIRAFDIVLLAASNVMMWKLMRRYSAVAAASLIILWTLTVVSFTYNETAQPDLWVGYAVLAAILASIGTSDYKARQLLFAGCMVGLCTLLKPFYAGFILAPLSAIWSRDVEHMRGRGAVVRHVALLSLGWGAPIIVMLTALWWRGAFSEFVAVHLRYNMQVYAFYDPPSLPQRILRMLDFFSQGKIIAVALAAIVAGIIELWRRDRAVARTFGLVIVVGTAGVVLQAKFFYYHWEPVLVACAPLAAVGLYFASDSSSKGTRTLAWATIGVLALNLSARPATYIGQWAAYLTGRESRDQYYHSKTWADPAAQLRVVEYVRSRSQPGEFIANWGANAAVPFLADRPNASRFPSTIVLMTAPRSEPTRAYQREFLKDMVDKQPSFVILDHLALRMGASSDTLLTDYVPGLADFLETNYEFDRNFGTLDVYRRRKTRRLTGSP